MDMIPQGQTENTEENNSRRVKRPRESKKAKIIQKHFFVTEEEDMQLKQKFELSGFTSFSEYLTHMGIHGYILIKDYSNVIDLIKEVHDIGVNLNSICKIAEENHEVTIEQITQLDDYMKKIYQKINETMKTERRIDRDKNSSKKRKKKEQNGDLSPEEISKMEDEME